MTRLTSDLHPLLTTDVLQALHKHSIFTTLNFIRKKPGILANITGLPYDKVLKVKDKILGKFSSALKRGDVFYREIVNNSFAISTGVRGLDNVLEGGFVSGKIYEICGLEGAGKTQLCLSIAISTIMTTPHQVLIIDTKYDYMICSRLLNMFCAHHNQPDYAILNRIRISQCGSACKLLNDLHCFKTQLLLGQDKSTGIKLIIIDSLSVLFQSFYNMTEGLCILNNIVNLLNFLASESNLVVIVTNFITSWTREKEETPALGRYWTHVPSSRIKVQKSGCADEILLSIVKSRTKAAEKEIKLRVTNVGLF